MFDLRGCAFRFGNVVGRRQTHGVGFDFVRRLLADPTRLAILGDGTPVQVLHPRHRRRRRRAARASSTPDAPFRAFNVATGDYITVREIAELAVDVLGLDPDDGRVEFTAATGAGRATSRSSGSTPSRIRALGWQAERRLAQEALRASMEAMLADLDAGVGS